MWEYRLVKDGPVESPSFTISEVYYNEAGEPYGWCSASVIGDDLKEAKKVHRMIAGAFDKPILDAKTITGSLDDQPDEDIPMETCPMCGKEVVDHNSCHLDARRQETK
jgi:hypothetical protein